MPADQVGAPRSGETWAVRTPSPPALFVRGARGWGPVGGNQTGVAGRDAFGSAGILARTSPIPSRANLSPPNNDGLNDSPHNQGSAFTKKALQKAREGNANEGAGAPRVAPRSGEIWAV